MIETKYILGTWSKPQGDAKLVADLQKFITKIANRTKCCVSLYAGKEPGPSNHHVHGVLLVPKTQLERFHERWNDLDASLTWHQTTGDWFFDVRPFEHGRSHSYTFIKHSPVPVEGCSRHGPCRRGCATHRVMPEAYEAYFRSYKLDI